MTPWPSFSVHSDPQTKWKVYTLRAPAEGYPDEALEAQVCPQAGGNVFSLKFRGQMTT